MKQRGQIGVVGASGAVGRVAVRLLAEFWNGPIRITVGRSGGFPDLPAGKTFERRRVDIDDASALKEFCRDCAVILNCAGPSYRILDRVARAAFDAGADYIDPGGDDVLADALAAAPLERGRVAILSAGLMPGLSALLPKWLAGQSGGVPTALTAYFCLRDYFSPGAAEDFLLAFSSGDAQPMAGWSAGKPAHRALDPLTEVHLPYFRGRVNGRPFLSREGARLARALELTEAQWYFVFEPGHFLNALSRAQENLGGQANAAEAARQLARAAELDLFGQQPYQQFVFRLQGSSGVSILLFRSSSVNELTAEVAVFAAMETAGGMVSAGTWFAAGVLDADKLVRRLRDCPSVQVLEVIDEAEPGVGACDEGSV